MQVLLLVCFVALVFASAPGRLNAHTEAEIQFTAWMKENNKVYATAEEYNLRLHNFKATLKRIALKNGKSSATYAVNKFSDLSPAEFKLKYLMKEPLTPITETTNLLKPTTEAVPATFDWRTQNVVTPVKDQEQCGSCWAFSVTENIESVWMLAKNQKIDTFQPLAPQQIVDCDTTDGGCNGGYPASAYQYVESAGGQETEAAYPYRGVDGTCAFNKAKVESTISNFKYATTKGDENTLKQNLVSAAPLSICVDAANWQDYSSGVMSAWDCCWFCQLDHCVQLVGYDSTASTPYYLVRNSWNTNWGEQGYIRLAMGSNTCGLTDYATTSIVN
jgi:C1A family cysteine protease